LLFKSLLLFANPCNKSPTIPLRGLAMLPSPLPIEKRKTSMNSFSKFFGRNRLARRAAPKRNTFRPTLERLEAREVPSITVNSTGSLASAHGDNNGVVTNDTFELRFKPGTSTLQLRQIVNNSVVQSVDLPSNVGQITIDSDGIDGGTDTLLIKA